MQSEINIKIGNKPPIEYFDVLTKHMIDNNRQVSGIVSEK